MPEPKAPTGINHPNPPPLPGVGVKQPTAAERAAIEAQWATMRNAPKSLAMLILWIEAHPEIGEWARASVDGTFRFSEG